MEKRPPRADILRKGEHQLILRAESFRQKAADMACKSEVALGTLKETYRHLAHTYNELADDAEDMANTLARMTATLDKIRH